MENCPICSAGGLVTAHVDYETQYRGYDGAIRDLVVPHVLLQTCQNCSEQLLDSTAVAQVEAAQRAALGRLTPGQLRSWRDELKKTQTELSATLGFGKKTYARWETGTYTLTAAADRYIRLVMASKDNYALLEQFAGSMAGIALEGQADDLAHVDFSALTNEFQSYFASDDPILKSSEAFSSELFEGRVFGV